MKSPKFSVIVLAFNCKNLLETTIDSILNQTYKDFEIIIVDDASTDDTDWFVELLKDEHRPLIKVHHNKVNKGPIGSLVAGQLKAAGDIVVQVDGDGDTIDPETLELYAERYEDPNVWMCGSMLDILVEKDRLPSPQRLYTGQCDRFGGVQQFRPSSWRWWLWSRVLREELINPETHAYWRMATECAFVWPMWELSGPGRVAFVPKPLYVHNLNNPLNIGRDLSRVRERDSFISVMLSRQPFLPLEDKNGTAQRRSKLYHFELKRGIDYTVDLDIKE